MTGGGTSTATVSLRYPAPPGGSVIALQSRGPSDVRIPQQVVIPENRSTTTFPIASKPVKASVSLNLSAKYQTAVATNGITILPAAKGQWFVSPTGSPSGQGTQSSPWDLATALAHGPGHTKIRPGDIVWLRGGRYTGTYLSTLNGSENEPIIVRAFPGERVDYRQSNRQRRKAAGVKSARLVGLVLGY